MKMSTNNQRLKVTNYKLAFVQNTKSEQITIISECPVKFEMRFTLRNFARSKL
jgi:hypothetical protein